VGSLRRGVEPICHALEIAPSTYWSAKTRPVSARSVRDAELAPQLRALWEKNYSVYGRRKLTKADPAAVRAPNLVKRDFTATARDRKWVADFTYCSTWSGIAQAFQVSAT
jgi:putative transposase